MSIRAICGCLAVLVAAVLSWPVFALAEPYAGLFVGGAFTQRTKVDEGFSLDSVSKVHVDTSELVGGKAGYFFEPTVLGGNLGLELEVYHFRPDMDTQTLTVSFGGFSGSFRFDRADLQVTPIALNALYRLPLARSPEFPRGRIHPYAGVGLGAFIARAESRTTILDDNMDFSDTDVQPGVQAIAGLRFFVSPRIAVFGEYKFVRTADFDLQLISDVGTRLGNRTLEIRQLDFHLNTHILQAGVAFHW